MNTVYVPEQFSHMLPLEFSLIASTCRERDQHKETGMVLSISGIIIIIIVYKDDWVGEKVSLPFFS